MFPTGFTRLNSETMQTRLLTKISQFKTSHSVFREMWKLERRSIYRGRGELFEYKLVRPFYPYPEELPPKKS